MFQFIRLFWLESGKRWSEKLKKKKNCAQHVIFFYAHRCERSKWLWWRICQFSCDWRQTTAYKLWSLSSKPLKRSLYILQFADICVVFFYSHRIKVFTTQKDRRKNISFVATDRTQYPRIKYSSHTQRVLINCCGIRGKIKRQSLFSNRKKTYIKWIFEWKFAINL